jgi:hypothetical protein
MSAIHGVNYGAPTLDLNFSKNKSLIDTVTGRNLVTFTRASTGTYVGADGLIKTAVANEPRFDHNPVTGESLGLLVEEARTNRHTYSEQFDNASWGKNGATVTANATAAPDGTTTADKFASTSGASIIAVQQADLTLTNGASYTRSVFAKASEISSLTLQVGNTSTGTVLVQANLSTGTATNGGVVTTLANGWFRISYSYTQSGTIGDFYLTLPANTVAGSGVFIWGAQLEAGAFPTSYIPTVASTVTRAADVASIGGSNFNAFNSTFLFTGFAVLASVSNRRHAEFAGSTGENRLLTNNDFYTSGTSGGNSGSPVSITADGTLSSYALAFSYDGSITEKRSAKNGALNSNTSATGLFLPSDPTFKFGANDSNMAGGFLARKTFKHITYYPSRLQDFQLQQLTK